MAQSYPNHAPKGDDALNQWRDAAERAGYRTRDRAQGGFCVESRACHEGGKDPTGVWVVLSANGYPYANCDNHEYPESDQNFRRNVGLPARRGAAPGQRSGAPPANRPGQTDFPTSGPDDQVIATYHDPTGKRPPRRVYRIDGPDGKRVWQDAHGDLSGYSPLEWAAEDAGGDWPCWTDGEKTARAVRDAGRVAFSTIGGHASAVKAAWEPAEVEQGILVLPDNTPQEIAAALDLAEHLARLGYVVGVLDPMGEPDTGQDAADFPPDVVRDHLDNAAAKWYRADDFPDPAEPPDDPGAVEDWPIILDMYADRFAIIDGAYMLLGREMGTWMPLLGKAQTAYEREMVGLEMRVLIDRARKQTGNTKPITARAVSQAIQSIGRAVVAPYEFPPLRDHYSHEVNAEIALPVKGGGGVHLATGGLLKADQFRDLLVVDIGAWLDYNPDLLAHPPDLAKVFLDHFPPDLLTRLAYAVMNVHKSIDVFVDEGESTGKSTLAESLARALPSLIRVMDASAMFSKGATEFTELNDALTTSRLVILDECDKVFQSGETGRLTTSDLNVITADQLRVNQKSIAAGHRPRTGSLFMFGGGPLPIETGQGTASRFQWLMKGYGKQLAPAHGLAMRRDTGFLSWLATYVINLCCETNQTGVTGATAQTRQDAALLVSQSIPEASLKLQDEFAEGTDDDFISNDRLRDILGPDFKRGFDKNIRRWVRSAFPNAECTTGRADGKVVRGVRRIRIPGDP